MKRHAARDEGLRAQRPQRLRAARRRRPSRTRRRQLGLKIAGHDGWDAGATSYVDLMTRIKATGADGLYIAGDEIHNGVAAAQGQGRGARPQRQGEGRRHRRLRLPLAAAEGRRVGDAKGSSVPRPRRRRTGSAARPAASSTPSRGPRATCRSTTGRSSRPARRRCCSTRSRAPTARARTWSRSCSPPTGRRPCSGRCRSTATATRSGRSRRCTGRVHGKWIYIGSQTYESKVKPGKVAGATKKVVSLRTAHPARDVYYAPYLPGRALHGGERPRDAAVGGRLPVDRVHRLAEDDRRRVLEPLGLAAGSPTTTTSTRPSASGWATCRTGCTSRPRRAGASRRCSTTGRRSRTRSRRTRCRR